jgi:hypothetical protein
VPVFFFLVAKMESSDREQRVNMKFCFKLGKSATETLQMLVEIYGDGAVIPKTVLQMV